MLLRLPVDPEWDDLQDAVVARQYIHDNNSFQRQARLWTGTPSLKKLSVLVSALLSHSQGTEQ